MYLAPVGRMAKTASTIFTKLPGTVPELYPGARGKEVRILFTIMLGLNELIAEL